MDRGTVTVTGGRPVAAEGALTAASVETGIAQRDEHLRGPSFFHADRHPYIGLRALRFEPAEDGWVVPAMLTVGGAETPGDPARAAAAGPGAGRDRAPDHRRVRPDDHADARTAAHGRPPRSRSRPS